MDNGEQEDVKEGLSRRKSLRRSEKAKKVLQSITNNGGPSVFSSAIQSKAKQQKVQDESVRFIIYPWTKAYKCWWGVTVGAAIFTVFFETYQIAFQTAGLPFTASSIIEYVLLSIFVVDMVVNFNLAYYNAMDEIVQDRWSIAVHYLRFWFWIDLLGVFPFYMVALAIAGQVGQNNTLTEYLALLRLFKMVRLHRVKMLFDILQYSTRVSLMWLTLTRNFSLALVWTHFFACVMYFVARMYDFDPDNTWIGEVVGSLDGFERYVTSLYWSVGTLLRVARLKTSMCRRF